MGLDCIENLLNLVLYIFYINFLIINDKDLI